MSDLKELYQEVILDHNKRPRNYRRIDGSCHHAVGHNPLCGDKVTIYVSVEGGRIKDLSFEGSGCAISKASASMMTESLAGRTLDEADALFHRFHALVTEDAPPPASLGKLIVFSGVREFPVRVKCASLAWHTLRAALDDRNVPISTE